MSAASFPLNTSALTTFDHLKKKLEKATLHLIDDSSPFVVEHDNSEVAISATLDQNCRLIAFMSRTLKGSKFRYPPIEKEAITIIEAVCKWCHFFSGQHFVLLTNKHGQLEAVKIFFKKTRSFFYAVK